MIEAFAEFVKVRDLLTSYKKTHLTEISRVG